MLNRKTHAQLQEIAELANCQSVGQSKKSGNRETVTGGIRGEGGRTDRLGNGEEEEEEQDLLTVNKERDTSKAFNL